MAKSKNGGSRTYIRGKLGADVYSVGKDGKGHKQQVIRSLAESVANPQTEAQMVGRMVMSTVMQAQSYFAQIIDHSFDGVPAGQPSISEFIKANYAIVKDNVGKSIGASLVSFNKYQEKGWLPSKCQLSRGNATPVLHVIYHEAQSQFEIFFGETLTFDALLENLGITRDDYITIVMPTQDMYGAITPLQLIRLHPSKTMEGTTVVTSDNVASVFEMEASVPPDVTFNAAAGGNNAYIAIKRNYGPYWSIYSAVITSRKSGDGYIHSTSYTSMEGGYSTCSSDQALATYPIGSQRFLNGGEI